MDRDEEVCLSEHALKALNEFYLEKQKSISGIGMVEEDWVIKYFFYSVIRFTT